MAVRKEGKLTPYRGPFCQKIVSASFLARVESPLQVHILVNETIPVRNDDYNLYLIKRPYEQEPPKGSCTNNR